MQSKKATEPILDSFLSVKYICDDDSNVNLKFHNLFKREKKKRDILFAPNTGEKRVETGDTK